MVRNFVLSFANFILGRCMLSFCSCEAILPLKSVKDSPSETKSGVIGECLGIGAAIRSLLSPCAQPSLRTIEFKLRKVGRARGSYFGIGGLDLFDICKQIRSGLICTF